VWSGQQLHTHRLSQLEQEKHTAMADRENRDYDDAEGSLDPELLYTKEYCIGWASHVCACGSI
jgi:hypothetical protein